MKKEYSAGLILFYQTKATIKFLLLRYELGHWDFPKGHIEANETKHATALRELQEEAGITHVHILPNFEHVITYFFTNKHHELVHKTVYFFIAQSATQEVTLSHEHTDYAWLPYEQALDTLTFSSAKDVLIAAEKFLVTAINQTT